MDRVRAARCLIDTKPPGQYAKNLELRGFMAIFHPEMSEKELRELEKDM